MKINADTRLRASAMIDDLPWHRSPDGSVERRMLDRDGGEVARATSVVRYPPGSQFPSHSHALGEEFLVLDGVFSDESGHYPVGTYVRNPPGSAHAPFSEQGCVIFVKLRQFDSGDLARVVVDTRCADYAEHPHPGLEALDLHHFGPEHVRLLRAVRATELHSVEWTGGAEFLVLQGRLADEDGVYPAGAWLRLPPGTHQRLVVSEASRFYLKTGHLGSGLS